MPKLSQMLHWLIMSHSGSLFKLVSHFYPLNWVVLEGGYCQPASFPCQHGYVSNRGRHGTYCTWSVSLFMCRSKCHALPCWPLTPSGWGWVRVVRSHTWSDAACGLYFADRCTSEADPPSCHNMRREILFTDWDGSDHKPHHAPLADAKREREKKKRDAVLPYASIFALSCRCLFPDDAAEKTPSVSEQLDLGWLIAYWLNCFDL